MRRIKRQPARMFAGRLAAFALGLCAPSLVEAAPSCWNPPGPQTVAETAKLWSGASDDSKKRYRRALEPALLALSGGGLKSAYGAGFFLGWGATGKRPDFRVVTALGAGGFVAPFAFIGKSGDAKIGELFNCGGKNWRAVAAMAASFIDAGAVAAIAAKHKAGGRLFIGLPSAAKRDAMIFDIGKIAAGGHPKAADYIRQIITAIADTEQTFTPDALKAAAPAKVGSQNWAFRHAGAGEAFLLPEAALPAVKSYFIIHNESLIREDAAEFAATLSPKTVNGPMVTAHDLEAKARSQSANFRIVTVRPRADLIAAQDFDAAYISQMFLLGFRRARMEEEWQGSVLGRRD